MFVISRKDTDFLKTGERYDIVDADMYEYLIQCSAEKTIWISKDDTENFDYHV